MSTRGVYRSFHRGAHLPARRRRAQHRLRRIRWRDNWTREMWWLLAALLVIGVLIGTGVIRHPPHFSVSDRP
jgi:hypothetical protein